jgi:hemoglobin
MRTRAFFLALLVAAALIAFACGGNKKPPPKEPTIVETVTDAGVDAPEDTGPPPQKSLFERLGGKEGITKIVEAIVKKVIADPKLAKRFANVKGAKLDKFKQGLAEILCEEGGGDCKYSGKPVGDVHAKMKIKDEDWNAFIGDVRSALDDEKVGGDEQGDIASAFSKFKEQVVDPKTRPPEKKK